MAAISPILPCPPPRTLPTLRSLTRCKCGEAGVLKAGGHQRWNVRGTRPVSSEPLGDGRAVYKGRGLEEAHRGGTMRPTSIAFAGLLPVGAAGCRPKPTAEPSGTG